MEEKSWSKCQICPDSDTLDCLELSCLWTYRPVILDPADPTWDVGNGTAWRWDVLAKEAESSFSQQCFEQASGVLVQPWEGPVSEETPGTTSFVRMCQGRWRTAAWGCLWCPPFSGYICPPRIPHSYLPSRTSGLLYTKVHISHDSLPFPKPQSPRLWSDRLGERLGGERHFCSS